MDQFSNILLNDLSGVTCQQDLLLHQFWIGAILTSSGLKHLSQHCSHDIYAGYSHS